MYHYYFVHHSKCTSCVNTLLLIYYFEHHSRCTSCVLNELQERVSGGKIGDVQMVVLAFQEKKQKQDEAYSPLQHLSPYRQPLTTVTNTAITSDAMSHVS